MMTIFKLDYLKSFESDLKQQLSIDKKYLPISKKLVALLRDVNPFLLTVERHLETSHQNFLNENVFINKSYAENIENFSKSLKIIIDKNQGEIDKSQKTCQKHIHDLNHKFKALLEIIEQKIERVQLQADEKVKDAQLIYSREVSQFSKLMNEARKKYQETTLAIEEEKKTGVELAANTYDLRMSEINMSLETDKAEIDVNIEKSRSNTQNLSKENDDIYLNIKNNYTSLSIQLNKKINELKKHYTQALNTIDKDHQALVKPIEKSIETLKINYQEAQQKALASYSEKLNSLNVLFDLQKEDYEKKKEKIIHESNEAVTLLNSKLSAFRESITKDKLLESREMRDLMKSMSDPHERDKTNHQLTRKLNALDNELNKQIIRTNKDILEKHRDQQRRLFSHDQKHLKEINEWRMQKALYEYEKKQEFAKIDLNFHHNMESTDQRLKLANQTYEYKKEVLLLTHNKDLLSLEYQLAIAQAVQERELNLLANDAHILIAQSKLIEKNLQYDYELKLVEADFEKQKAKAIYHADTQVLNITIQLEMEKAKARRDFDIKEQEYKTELSSLILNKAKDQINFDLNHKIKEIELEKEIHYIENKNQLDTYKYQQTLEVEKREHLITEAKYRNQYRLSNEKSTRLLKTYKNELELNQEQTTSYLSVIRKLYKNDQEFKDILIELYHLPSHPEVIKSLIKTLEELHEVKHQSLLAINDHFQTTDQAFYVNKIEDLTGYKYMLKHENMMNFYDQEIQKTNDKKKVIEKEIKTLEESFFANQTSLERNHAFINQLTKIGHDLKSNDLKSYQKHHDLKENQKLISNHEHEVKRIKQQLIRIEKEIDKKHKELTPLDHELDYISQKQKTAEHDLNQAKHDEASNIYKFLRRNQAIYQSLAILINKHYDNIKSFLKSLHDEVYLSDSFIDQMLKKHQLELMRYEKQLGMIQLRFLDLMYDFYLTNEMEQKKLIKGIKDLTASLIRGVDRSYNNRMLRLNKAHKKQNKQSTHFIQLQKEKSKKRAELEFITYQKKLAVDHLVLRDLENRIQENTLKRAQELKTLNENQVSIALQYRQDYEHQLSKLDSDYQKQIATIMTGKETQQKNLDTQQSQNEAKNQMILSKYLQTHEKHLQSLSQRRLQFDQQMDKAKSLEQQRMKQLDILLKNMNQKREHELRNIQFHMKRFQITTKREQARVLNKEIKVLKKSHRFRVKMLQLN